MLITRSCNARLLSHSRVRSAYKRVAVFELCHSESILWQWPRGEASERANSDAGETLGGHGSSLCNIDDIATMIRGNWHRSINQKKYQLPAGGIPQRGRRVQKDSSEAGDRCVISGTYSRPETGGSFQVGGHLEYNTWMIKALRGHH